MAEGNGGVILTWNVTNWVTIILMAAAGFAAIGLGQKVWQKRKGTAAAA